MICFHIRKFFWTFLLAMPRSGTSSLAISQVSIPDWALAFGGGGYSHSRGEEGNLLGDLKLKWEETGPFMWWNWAFFEELFVSRKPNSGQRQKPHHCFLPPWKITQRTSLPSGGMAAQATRLELSVLSLQDEKQQRAGAHSEPLPTGSTHPVLFLLPVLEKAHAMVNKSLDSRSCPI